MDIDMRIRRATVEDTEEIAHIHVRSWQWAYRGQIPDEYLDGLDRTVERRIAWRKQMLEDVDAIHRVWVAVDGEVVVGFADTRRSPDEDATPDTGEISAIYVDPSAARHGAGRALLTRAVADLRERGFGPITLWVLASNERARRFYEAMGWQPDGASKDDDRPGFVLHEVRYRLEAPDRGHPRYNSSFGLERLLRVEAGSWM